MLLHSLAGDTRIVAADHMDFTTAGHRPKRQTGSHMSHEYRYSCVEDDRQAAALGEILRHTFHFPPERVPRFFEVAGRENLRVLHAGGDVIGGLVLIPMGQFFGGRSVKTAGVAAVAIDQHERGRGAASALMSSAVREMRAMGFSLSSLYPATQPLYRRAGYEQAGTAYRCVLPTAHIEAVGREERIRPVTDADASVIERCYLERARRVNGHLDRGRYIWSRVQNHRGTEARGFVVECDGTVEGYTYLIRQDSPTRPYNLLCTDLVANTASAARRLLQFFADHRSMVGEVIWRGSPVDAIHLSLREQAVRDEVKDHWMLRLLDAACAFEGRGYAPGVFGELHLEVHGDDVLPEVNNGRLLVQVAEGRAQVQRGAGRGSVRVHIRGLASIYSGFLSPWQARAAGWIEGEDDAIARLAAALAGAAPWIADDF